MCVSKECEITSLLTCATFPRALISHLCNSVYYSAYRTVNIGSIIVPCVQPQTSGPMSLLKFFKATNALPTAKDTGLLEHVIRVANKAVESAQKEQQPNEAPPAKKKKYTTTFSPEDRTEIRRYAANNGNTAAVRKYSVGESTACLFKTKYLAALCAQGGGKPELTCSVVYCLV